jgi:hypothetical protein
VHQASRRFQTPDKKLRQLLLMFPADGRDAMAVSLVLVCTVWPVGQTWYARINFNAHNMAVGKGHAKSGAAEKG